MVSQPMKMVTIKNNVVVGEDYVWLTIAQNRTFLTIRIFCVNVKLLNYKIPPPLIKSNDGFYMVHFWSCDFIIHV